MNNADTAVVLLCAALVLFMTPGLACFYGGLGRRKNVVNNILASLFTIGLEIVLWICVSWAEIESYSDWAASSWDCVSASWFAASLAAAVASATSSAKARSGLPSTARAPAALSIIFNALRREREGVRLVSSVF